MSKERTRNRDGREGDVLVNDSVASGKPSLPIDQDPSRGTDIAIDADELGERKESDRQPARGLTPPPQGRDSD